MTSEGRHNFYVKGSDLRLDSLHGPNLGHVPSILRSTRGTKSPRRGERSEYTRGLPRELASPPPRFRATKRGFSKFLEEGVRESKFFF